MSSSWGGLTSRSRKSTSHNAAPDHGRNDHPDDAHTKKSSFFMGRRKEKSESVLPLTTAHTARPKKYQSSKRNGMDASPCNVFLLGGNYYSSKDKQARAYRHQRRLRRKHSLWYRVCCSSTPRQIISAIFILGFLHHWIFSRTKRRSEDKDVMFSALRSVADWRSETVHIIEQIQFIEARPNSQQNVRKREIWQEIVPHFLHRNDVPKKQKPSIASKNTIAVDSKTQAEEDPVHAHSNKNKNEKTKHAEKQERREMESQNTTTILESKDLRTLQNMDTLQVTSSCPSEPVSPDAISTTLVVQASLDRLWILEETCRRWSDPIVVVVYLEENGVLPDVPCPQLRFLSHPSTAGTHYPINVMRNIGLDAVTTSHILVLDIDFIPSTDLNVIIQDTVRSRISLPESQKRAKEAIVVPAYERTLAEPCKTMDECKSHMEKDPQFIPRSIEGLRGCVSAKDCIVFQSDVNWDGHATTNSKAWLRGDWYEEADKSKGEGDNRLIKEIKCFDSIRYEPYVVLPWCPMKGSNEESSDPRRPIAPYFDERFHGYGKNKIQHVSHLRFLGYSWWVLPRGFVLHHPHPPSTTKREWENKEEFRLHKEMDELYPQFLYDLVKKYNKGHDAIATCHTAHFKKEKS